MDMQKEREAFENYGKNAVIVKLVDFSGDQYVAKNSGTWHDIARSQSAADKLNNDFSLWQAAKASAVPDGFVVIDSEPNRKVLEKLSCIFPDICDSRIFVTAYKAMIEAAQEQS